MIMSLDDVCQGLTSLILAILLLLSLRAPLLCLYGSRHGSIALACAALQAGLLPGRLCGQLARLGLWTAYLLRLLPRLLLQLLCSRLLLLLMLLRLPNWLSCIITTDVGTYDNVFYPWILKATELKRLPDWTIKAHLFYSHRSEVSKHPLDKVYEQAVTRKHTFLHDSVRCSRRRLFRRSSRAIRRGACSAGPLLRLLCVLPLLSSLCVLALGLCGRLHTWMEEART